MYITGYKDSISKYDIYRKYPYTRNIQHTGEYYTAKLQDEERHLDTKRYCTL